MSEPVAKARPSVDFDEFERRIRQSERPNDDPLAELARLVGEHHDPYGDVFGEEAMARRAAEYEALQHAGHYEPAPHGDHAAADHAGGDHRNLSPRLSGDFAAIEAGLRGAVPTHVQAQHDHDYYSEHAPHHEDHAYQQDQAYLQDHESQQWAEAPQEAAAPAQRSRRSVYAMVATIAVGVIGVGAAFAYKGSSSSPSEIKTIAAATGPTKIQPPAETPADQAGQDSAMLSKGQQEQPTQLVSREEQPVDISQAVQDNSSRNADAGGAPGDASNVPVPPSPSQAANGVSPPSTSSSPSPSEQIGSFGMSGMPAPKKVKVVSVRPDGTILPNDAPPVAAMPTSIPSLAKPTETQAPIAKTSTPKSTKPATAAKTTSRAPATKPTKVASTDSASDTDNAAPAPKATKKTKPAKPQRVASTDATGDNEQTASVPTAKSGGGFAVQLAAPGTEADAKAASSRFAKKFAGALGSHKLGFRKADSNGKSVYRVRVGSLSKEEATSLCEKLKADGGSCFVAKN